MRTLLPIALAMLPMLANAEIKEINKCQGALACEVTDAPPNPVRPDPNNGKLLAWNEAQNVILEENLPIDRVADPNSPFVERQPDGTYVILAGTAVSSHYLQWDPGGLSAGFVAATIKLDAPIFGFIIEDTKLFGSDAALGLPDHDYADFWLRGLEPGDWTSMRGDEVEITWWAGSPGDWTRLITASALLSQGPTAPEVLASNAQPATSKP